MTKTVGDFEVETWPNSDAVLLRHQCNPSTFEPMRFEVRDIPDLIYALQCVLREADERSAQRRSGESE